MDVTPLVPAGRQLIDAYGDGGFRIAGRRWDGPVLVTSSRTRVWPVHDMAGVSLESLIELFAPEADPVDLLLLGCGRSMQPPPPGFRQALKARGVGLELMDTGAACRTYNVLLAEERRVGAALIAV